MRFDHYARWFVYDLDGRVGFILGIERRSKLDKFRQPSKSGRKYLVGIQSFGLQGQYP